MNLDLDLLVCLSAGHLAGDVMLRGLGQGSWSKTASSSLSIGHVLLVFVVQDELPKFSPLSNGSVYLERLL